MAKKNKYSMKSSEFHDYFEGKLSNRERNAFERKMQKDLFNQDAAEGLAMVSREEAEEDLANAGKKIRQRINLRRRIGWYSAAATLAAILTITTIFLTVDNDPDSQDKRIREMNKSLENTFVEKTDSKKTDEKDEQKNAYVGEAEAPEQKGEQKEEAVELATVPGESSIAGNEATPEVAAEDESIIANDEVMDEVIEEVVAEADLLMETLGEGAGEGADQEEEMDFSMEMADEAVLDEVLVFDQEADETEAVIKREVVMPTQAAEITTGSVEKSSKSAKGKAVASKQVDGPAGVTVSLESTQASPVQEAAPLNGMPAYMVYLDSTLVFPATELSKSAALVDLSFYIKPDGKPDRLQVISSPSKAFSDEAIRVIKNGPLWTPASKDGMYNNSSVEMRIEFKEKHKR